MRLVEIYTSVKGEGRNTGKMIQIVRFGGRNYQCAGLPCDRQHAIDQQFSDRWEQVTVDDVLSRIKPWPKHVCITGGEPLTQRSSEMRALTENLTSNHYDIDLFTNGSRPLPEWTGISYVTTIMDWKLDGSGEGGNDIEQRLANLKLLSPWDAVKFVVKNEHDLDQARHVYALHNIDKMPLDVYVGAVWGAIKDDEIINFLKHYQLDWSLNCQVHKYDWDPNRIGV